MKIQTSLIIYDGELHKEIIPSFFTIEGSESQIIWKLQKDILITIAMHNSSLNRTELQTEFKILKEKYKLGEFPE